MLQSGVTEEFTCGIFCFSHAVGYQKDARSMFEGRCISGEFSPVDQTDRQIRSSKLVYALAGADERNGMTAIYVVQPSGVAQFQNAHGRILAYILCTDVL